MSRQHAIMIERSPRNIRQKRDVRLGGMELTDIKHFANDAQEHLGVELYFVRAVPDYSTPVVYARGNKFQCTLAAGFFAGWRAARRLL